MEGGGGGKTIKNFEKTVRMESWEDGNDMVIHCQLKKMIQIKLKLGLSIACVHHGERNQINTPRLIL